MIAQLFLQTLGSCLVMGLLLFGGAGILAWPSAWAYLAFTALSSLGMGLWLAKHNPNFLKERMRFLVQKGQPLADKILSAFLVPVFGAWLFSMGIGVRQNILFTKGLEIPGLILLVSGLMLGLNALRINTFAVPIVKIQAHQEVIDTGPYRFVRHPLYSGAILYFLGLPLFLGVPLGFLLVPVLIAMLALRLLIEEHTLRLQLEGYASYMQRVRWRLIPLVW